MLLKQKVYISLILAIVVPLAVSTFLFSNSIQNHTDEKLAKVDLPTALSEVKSKIELELATPIIVAKEIAQNSFVKQWLSNGESEQARTDYINYLASIKKDNNAVIAYQQYQLGEGKEGFIHIAAHIMAGRSIEQKQNMKTSEQLCNGLNEESNILKDLLGKFTL